MTRKAHVPRVFVDAALAAGDTLAPSAAKRHHLASVLRLGANASVILFNGDGYEYAAHIVEATRKTMTLHVDSRRARQRESPLDITLVQAIARGDRMDFAIAKAVELGVTRIQPVFTERGKVALDGARLDKKQTHWNSVARSAAEQSGRLICPPVTPALTLARYQPADASALCLILAPEAGNPPGTLERHSRIELLIGPEPGLSTNEIATATNAGWRPLGLGPRVLRTETAGIAALAVLQTRWGDLG